MPLQGGASGQALDEQVAPPMPEANTDCSRALRWPPPTFRGYLIDSHGQRVLHTSGLFSVGVSVGCVGVCRGMCGVVARAYGGLHFS